MGQRKNQRLGLVALPNKGRALAMAALIAWCALLPGNGWPLTDKGAGSDAAWADPVAGITPLSEESLSAIDGIVQTEIASGHLPGAVVLIGQGDRVVYRRAFGQRSRQSVAVQSRDEPMSVDTIFDIASVTKVVVTTTAVLQLIERHKLALDTPAAQYWPDFGGQGKSGITVRQLLTHSSGLPAGLNTVDLKGGGATQAALIRKRLATVKPTQAAGRDVLYSDVNFAVLGELVTRRTGLSLNTYADRHIFTPLKMKDSGYLPRRGSRLAPTSMPAGTVHDPLARSLGGVAGNAGVFSSADDLAVLARTLLHGGGPILSAASVRAMLSPQTPPGQSPAGVPRGFGWRLDPVLASNRAALPPVGAASHFGYTGTGVWLDPVRQVYVLVLSNRLHPSDGGDAGPLRAKVIAAVSEALGPLAAQAITKARPELAAAVAPYLVNRPAQPVSAGIDTLSAQGFAPLQGKRLGLLTHRSAVDGNGRRTIDVLANAPGVTLVRLFSPEHGLSADQEGKIKDDKDPLTGLPIVSLYGDQRHPTPAVLAGLDTLVVDLQDVGVRFYTYASSVAYLMEAAAPLQIPVTLLDRPNPIGADAVQGPLLDSERRSFTGYWPLPVRHGLTLGELARLFAGEAAIPVELTVIPLQHYKRGAYFDQCGLPWIPPSPNLVRLASATLYPGVGMIEGAAISVGRGTTTPFEVVGAPWINKQQLSDALNTLGLAGLSFRPTEFTPTANPYAGKTCQGVGLEVSKREALNSPALGIALAATLYRLYPESFSLEHTLGNVGSRAALDDIRAGLSVQDIISRWDQALHDFRGVRERYLLYRE